MQLYTCMNSTCLRWTKIGWRGTRGVGNGLIMERHLGEWRGNLSWYKRLRCLPLRQDGSSVGIRFSNSNRSNKCLIHPLVFLRSPTNKASNTFISNHLFEQATIYIGSVHRLSNETCRNPKHNGPSFIALESLYAHTLQQLLVFLSFTSLLHQRTTPLHFALSILDQL
jgi:hypothetical protein